jgi:hypothetical protein
MVSSPSSVHFVLRLHLDGTTFIAHSDAKPNENDDATKHAILKTLFSFQLAQNRHAAFASWLNTHLALL